MARALEPDTRISSTGALMALSYAKTGRSPRDKRMLKEPGSEKDVWWGGASPNHPMEEREFLVNRQRTVDFLNFSEHVYVVDAFVNWKQSARLKIRVICTRPYVSALFVSHCLPFLPPFAIPARGCTSQKQAFPLPSFPPNALLIPPSPLFSQPRSTLSSCSTCSSGPHLKSSRTLGNPTSSSTTVRVCVCVCARGCAHFRH
jgi:hypothetical protein